MSSRNKKRNSNHLLAPFTDSKCRKTEKRVYTNDRLHLVERGFFLKCPTEFIDFLEFCYSIDEEKPLEIFVESTGFRLVGPFEVISNNNIEKVDDGQFSQCYRYFHDPPEFVTLMADAKERHIGYHRDAPSDTASLLVESDPTKTGRLTILGESLFSVIKKLLSEHSGTKKLLKKLEVFADSRSINTISDSSVVKKRLKSCVCKTMNGAGLFINTTEGGIGYRPLGESYEKLAACLKTAFETNMDESKRQLKLGLVDELITCAQFANDEGDYGNSLDLGLSLLAFHPYGIPLEEAQLLNRRIKHLLSVGYRLANRPEFATVASDHMDNRKLVPKELDI